MKRRDFLKMTSALPISLSMAGLAQKAYAASPAYSNVTVPAAPSVMPQVINIFMYGGASELAGNLSNIADINMNSQNDYTADNAFRSRFLDAATDNDPTNRSRRQDGQITANNFWKEAGGTHMEDMLAARDMTVYRTLYKKASPTRSHRESIFMSHKGTVDIENSPGIGSRLALMLLQHKSTYQGASLGDGSTITRIEDLTLPFVSFEGDSQTYALDPDNTIPLELRGITMDRNFRNPYTRSINGPTTNSNDMIEALKGIRFEQLAANRSKYSAAWDGFEKRDQLEQKMSDLGALLNGTTGSAATVGVEYPADGFGPQLEAAVTLAIHNPETLYMAVGTPGLGGWDDHNNGIDSYPNRMNNLMESLKAAMAHIKAAQNHPGIRTINGNERTDTGNIIINVFGDFGRLVNLNDSGGWDHANNQNLYTFGGASVRPANEAAVLGQVVGTTHREGNKGTNNQYTVPDSDSLTWEPMAVASSIYQYFGATNSPILTADPVNLDGFETFADKLPSI